MQGGPHLILILSAVSITFSSAQTDLCGTSEIQCHREAMCARVQGDFLEMAKNVNSRVGQVHPAVRPRADFRSVRH
eukprot:3779506-Rhodomonas_salina.2